MIGATITAIPFGVVDPKGRTVGACIYRWHGARYEGDRMPEGKPWGAEFRAVRGDAPFGACQPDHWFATTAEREAAIEKYLTAARKRALKSFHGKVST